MVRALVKATTTDGVVRLDQVNELRGLPSYAAVASANPFEFVRGAYNWKDSNTRILSQGLGNAMLPTGGMTEHIVIGDSTSDGSITANGTQLWDRLRAWPLAMRDQLANDGIPANGTGFIRAVDSSWIDSRIVYSGTWTGATAYTTGGAVSSTATYSPDRSGTMLDVWYLDSTGAVVSVAVDGTTVGTITANGGVAAWKNFRIPATIIGGISKVVLTVTTVGASGFIYSGISVWTPNAGLIMHNVAQGGSRAGGATGIPNGRSNWSDTGQLGAVYVDVAGRRRTVSDAATTSGSSTLTSTTGAFTSRDLGKPVDHLSPGSGGLMFPPGSYIGAILSSTTVTMYSGPTVSNGVVVPAAPVNALNTLTSQSASIGRDPSCVHIALGGNDLSAGRTDAQITTDITFIRNQFPNSDCILHLVHEWDPAVVSSAREATFQAAMYALADTLDVPLYDWRTRIGSYVNGLAAGVYGDSYGHVTPASGGSLGSDLASLLGDGSGRTQTPGVPVWDNDTVNKAYIDNRKVKATPGALTSSTSELVVMKLAIPPGGFKVGDVLDYIFSGRPGGGTNTTTTVRVRIGTTGTTSDAAVVQMSATAAINTNPRYFEGKTAIQAIGASATHLGVGSESVAAISAAGTATATSGTFNSAVANYVTVTIQSSIINAFQVFGGILKWE